MKNERLLNILGTFIIPVYTIIFASNAPWETASLSYIGNYLDKQISFFVWAVLVCVFILFKMKDIFTTIKYENPKTRKVLLIACGLFILAVFVPYLPNVFPFLAFLHTILAFVSPIFLLSAISMFVFFLKHYNFKLYKSSMLWLFLIAAVAVLMLIKYEQVNSLLEVFVVLSATTFLQMLGKSLKEKSKHN